MKSSPHQNSIGIEVFEDAEVMMQGDTWDLLRIPGARLNPHYSHHYLHFTEFPSPFRAIVKRYMRWKVTSLSLEECRYKVARLTMFIQFFAARHPDATGLQNLNRTDIEAYMQHLLTVPGRAGRSLSERQRSSSMYNLLRFLEYVERSSPDDSPKTNFSRLIWPEDMGRQRHNRLSEARPKHLSQFVLQQLEEHMHELVTPYLSVVIILRASGWRISDVLNLRYDACLQKTDSGWWLCGDILKTRVKNHRVPISEEIAQVVSSQVVSVQANFPPEINVGRYLFVSSYPGREGKPMLSNSVQAVLNRFTARCQIVDEQGNPTRIHTHAFRHTKGVELINNGMSLAHVQKWLAHLTPEMTAVYAKILDPTMRREWEMAMANGAVRITTEGVPALTNPVNMENEEQLEMEYIRHNLDTVSLPNGFCFKSRKIECPTQAIPCHTCHNFCTTPEFLPQFQAEKRRMLEIIELSERAGRIQSAERNRQNLQPVSQIIELLEQGKIHHKAGKSGREYTSEELEAKTKNVRE